MMTWKRECKHNNRESPSARVFLQTLIICLRSKQPNEDSSFSLSLSPLVMFPYHPRRSVHSLIIFEQRAYNYPNIVNCRILTGPHLFYQKVARTRSHHSPQPPQQSTSHQKCTRFAKRFPLRARSTLPKYSLEAFIFLLLCSSSIWVLCNNCFHMHSPLGTLELPETMS